jgi:hypothetical protein
MRCEDFFLGMRTWNDRLVLLHSSLLLVVIIQVAVLALAFSIYQSIRVWACICITVSAVLMVAMVAHALKEEVSESKKGTFA